MKIKSFTIIEIIIVMIITVMISTAIYFLYSKINKQFHDYYSLRQSFYYYQIFDNQIRKDIFDSHKIILLDNKSFMLKTANYKILYKFGNHKLTRIILNNNVESSFEVEDYNLKKINNEVPSFTIQFKIKDLIFKSFYFKDYGLAYKINKNY